MAGIRRRDRSEVSIVTKYFLFFQCFIMWLVGLALMAVGAYILTYKKKRVRDAIDFFLDPSCDLCLAGSVAFFVSFFGCMGSLRENVVFLKIYYYFTAIFLLGEVVLAILVFIFYYVPDVRQKLHLFPEETFRDAILKYRDDPDMQNLIDNFQTSMECCGLSNDNEGYKDWNNNVYFNCTASNPSPERCSVPPSCCRIKPGDTTNILCGAHINKIDKGGFVVPQDVSRIYTKGCLKALGDWINAHSLMIGGILIGILIPQVIFICMARNMIDSVKVQLHKQRLNEERQLRQERQRDQNTERY
ncbi:tetraspanin-33-like [Gigantopelta aegis]|uniref:tetraspanin-33-like n=1 Tax=Gigantopelta aegis TaxID=1735272 RepID=UPI001B88BCCC|nr:tetraspanin-33-like [Gigantopelta aegis]